MSVFNKILIFVFIILSVVVIGEIFYFLYYSKINANKTPPLANTTINNSIASPTITSLDKRSLNQDFLEALKKTPKDIIISSTIINTFKGKITKIKILDKEEKFEDHDYYYRVDLRLKGKEGGELNRLYNDQELGKIAVVELTDDNKEIPIKFSDLKINDEITLEESINLHISVKDNLIKTKITKI